MSWRLTVAACAVSGLFGLVLASNAAAQDTLSATCSTSSDQSSPCTSAWYTSPITLEWSTDSLASSTSPCLLSIGYSHAEDENDVLTCTAQFPDGTSDTRTIHLRVEVSSPTATATAQRPPDSNGWYNHPVAIAFTGSAFSGIVGCTAPVTYSGPAGSGVPIAGSCTDQAGKTATVALPINYDASPPSAQLTAGLDGSAVDVRWSATAAPAPLVAAVIARSAGGAPGTSSVVSTAAAGTWLDTGVRPGDTYTYTLTAVDAAGNTTTQSASVVVPAPPATTATRPTARRDTPPLLHWRAVRGATYYNVQLYRGHKILSSWPRTARLRLRRSWRYRGHREQLRGGRYRWYVWPGFGSRRADRYGRLAASGTFVIR
jgi:hypothetical protein